MCWATGLNFPTCPRSPRTPAPRINPTPSPFSIVLDLPFRGLGARPVENNVQWNWSCQLQHQRRLLPPRPLDCPPPCLGTTLTTHNPPPQGKSMPLFIPTWQVCWKEGEAKREEEETWTGSNPAFKNKTKYPRPKELPMSPKWSPKLSSVFFFSCSPPKYCPRN